MSDKPKRVIIKCAVWVDAFLPIEFETDYKGGPEEDYMYHDEAQKVMRQKLEAAFPKWNTMENFKGGVYGPSYMTINDVAIDRDEGGRESD